MVLNLAACVLAKLAFIVIQARLCGWILSQLNFFFFSLCLNFLCTFLSFNYGYE